MRSSLIPAFRGLIIHQNEPARQRARELVGHARVRHSTAAKKEGGSLVRGINESDRVARLRLRRLRFVREQFFLAAVAHNLKRLVRFLSQPKTLVLPATTQSNADKTNRQPQVPRWKGFLLSDLFNTHACLQHLTSSACFKRARSLQLLGDLRFSAFDGQRHWRRGYEAGASGLRSQVACGA